MSFWNGTGWVQPDRAQVPSAGGPKIRAHVALALLVAAVIVIPTSQAAAGSGLSSVWIETNAGARAGAASIAYGDAFVVGYRTSERKPWAHVVCFANASSVFARTYGDGSIWGMDYSVYAGGPQPQDFVAGLSVDGNWAGGGADCRVDLRKYSNNYSRWTVLASSWFTVIA